MTKYVFNSFQAWNAIYIFFRSLWDLDPSRFAAKGTGVGAFLSFSNMEFEDDYEWRRVCVNVLQKPCLLDEKLAPDDIHKLALGMIEKYEKKFRFDLSSLKTIMTGLRSFPNAFKKEESLWQEAFERTGRGERWEWLRGYSFAQWSEPVTN